MAGKGVIVEFDFAVMDGAELLFETTKRFLRELDGIDCDARAEAKYLVGAPYRDGLGRLFALAKTKKTAQKAARDLAAAFAAAVTGAIPGAVSAAFRNFVKALADKGVRVVIMTHADETTARSALAPVLGENVQLYCDVSNCYGTVSSAAWRRACAACALSVSSTLAIPGSGSGVKSALLAGMGSVAVAKARIAYQDFGGADAVVDELSGKTAKKVLEKLRL